MKTTRPHPVMRGVMLQRHGGQPPLCKTPKIPFVNQGISSMQKSPFKVAVGSFLIVCILGGFIALALGYRPADGDVGRVLFLGCGFLVVASITVATGLGYDVFGKNKDK